MKASTLIAHLQELVAKHGDKEIAIDDGFDLAQITEVDLSAEEDDAIVIWFKS